jgi:hypothetical protein
MKLGNEEPKEQGDGERNSAMKVQKEFASAVNEILMIKMRKRIILSAVQYGHVTCSTEVFEKRVLRRIFGCNREVIIVG